MKISDRNSAVHFLLEGSDARYLLSEKKMGMEDARRFMSSEFLLMKPLFRKRIQYLTKPFCKVLQEDSNELKKILDEEAIKESGTFIVPGNGTVTVFYNIDFDPIKVKGDWWVAALMNLQPYKEPIMTFYLHELDGRVMSYMNLEADHEVQLNVEFIFVLILFIKYCKIETKIIAAGKKALHTNEKYVNDTKLPIEVLDATWFTTIIRTRGFSVGERTGGFWRLQRFGPGLTDKKLLWIAPYEKKGYTRRAKVLKDREGDLEPGRNPS